MLLARLLAITTAVCLITYSITHILFNNTEMNLTQFILKISFTEHTETWCTCIFMNIIFQWAIGRPLISMTSYAWCTLSARCIMLTMNHNLPFKVKHVLFLLINFKSSVDLFLTTQTVVFGGHIIDPQIRIPSMDEEGRVSGHLINRQTNELVSDTNK